MSVNTGIFDLRPRLSPLPAPLNRVSARALSVLLLAALVATLVLLADRFVSTWADEHLFLGWVVLWLVIFGGLALFAGTARAMAARAIRALDGWSQARAQLRAEARLWVIAHSDPRVMADLVALRTHADAENPLRTTSAPAGTAPQAPACEARGWAAYIERLEASRLRNVYAYYI